MDYCLLISYMST